MKKNFFVFLGLFLAACSSVPAFSERDNGKTFTVHIGEKHTISLFENPTTGYSWQFFVSPENQQVISDVKEIYVAPDTNLTGAGGVKKYTFTIRRKGTATVTGYYRRLWEKPDDINDQKVTFTFNVAD